VLGGGRGRGIPTLKIITQRTKAEGCMNEDLRREEKNLIKFEAEERETLEKTLF